MYAKQGSGHFGRKQVFKRHNKPLYQPDRKNVRLVINGLRDYCQGMKCRLRITECTLILIDRRLL